MTDSETDGAMTYGLHDLHDDGDHGDRDGDRFASPASTGRRMPLSAAVLLADAGIAFVAFVVLIIISIQRFGDEAQSVRDTAFTEALIILFVVAALFGTAATLLIRAGRRRIGVVQIAITAVVLGCGVFAAVSGPPKADPSVVVPADQYANDNQSVSPPVVPSVTS